VFFTGAAAVSPLNRPQGRCFGHCEGDFLDILGCGGEQALYCDSGEASKAGISVTVELFGIGKGAFHRLLSSLV